MILLPISVLTLSCFAGKAFTEILQCYECDDCKASNKTLLRACPQIMNTNSPANMFPETTISSVITTTTLEATTLETTTIPPTTMPPTTIPPTTMPPTTLQITTAAAAVDEGVATTAPVVEYITTLAPASTSSDTESATIADVTATTTATTTVVIAEEANEEETEIVRKRSVREVSSRSPLLHRFAREAEISHHCFSIKGYGGDKKKVKKGCVEVIGNKNPCDVLKEQYNTPLKSCRACKENKCNSGAVGFLPSISLPLLILVLAIFIGNTTELIF